MYMGTLFRGGNKSAVDGLDDVNETQPSATYPQPGICSDSHVLVNKNNNKVDGNNVVFV